jgi:hypothetical protein
MQNNLMHIHTCTSLSLSIIVLISYISIIHVYTCTEILALLVYSLMKIPTPKLPQCRSTPASSP